MSDFENLSPPETRMGATWAPKDIHWNRLRPGEQLSKLRCRHTKNGVEGVDELFEVYFEGKGVAVSEVRFVVPGVPVPWDRSGHRGRQHFTQPKDRAYRARVTSLCFAAMREARLSPFKGPVELTVWAYWPARAGKARPVERKPSRPDADNGAMKSYMDSCNGLVLVDDAQVTDAHVYKRRAKTGDAPRVELLFREVPLVPEGEW